MLNLDLFTRLSFLFGKMADKMTNTLEEAARKRKEKLAELRKKAKSKEQREDPQNAEIDPDELAPPKKTIKFRNYIPKDETLKEKKIEDAKPLAVKELVKEHLEKAKPEAVMQDVDITNLAPRKPDWDLKRDVAKKLEKLERRTQRAIVELIRQRLDEGKEDLASAVNAASDVAR